MRVKELAAFIKEREAVRVRKESGKKRPWTKDPILNTYRFCNVHREDDGVSKWLRTQWYPYFMDSNARGDNGVADIWFTAVVARLLNLPESLRAVQHVIIPFQPEEFIRILHARKAQGLKNFNGAYIVSTNGHAMDKVEYITYRVLNMLWEARERMRPKAGDTLALYHDLLMSFDGLGSFRAAQVVADLKYIQPLRNAADWGTFAASGPGSRRGLNRVLDEGVERHWRESDWRAKLSELLNHPTIAKFELHAQDLQNCLCEFDKYERARLGVGTPKQIYKEGKNAEL